MKIFDDTIKKLESKIEEGNIWIIVSNGITKGMARKSLAFLEKSLPDGKYLNIDGRTCFARPAYPRSDRRSDTEFMKRMAQRYGEMSAVSYVSRVYEVKNGEAVKLFNMREIWGEKKRNED